MHNLVDGKTWDVPYESPSNYCREWKWIRATYWPVKLKWYWDKFLIKIGIKKPAAWLQPHQGFSERQLDEMRIKRVETQRKYNDMAFKKLAELEVKLKNPVGRSQQDIDAITDSVNTIRLRIHLPKIL